MSTLDHKARSRGVDEALPSNFRGSSSFSFEWMFRLGRESIAPISDTMCSDYFQLSRFRVATLTRKSILGNKAHDLIINLRRPQVNFRLNVYSSQYVSFNGVITNLGGGWSRNGEVQKEKSFLPWSGVATNKLGPISISTRPIYGVNSSSMWQWRWKMTKDHAWP